MALVSVVPANDMFDSATLARFTLVRFAVGPIRYPLFNCQPVGSVGVPVVPPELTFVKVALVRFALARFVLPRLALLRLAVGPIRYPLINCQLVGSVGVPLTPPEETSVNVAVVRSIPSRFASARLAELCRHA